MLRRGTLERLGFRVLRVFNSPGDETTRRLQEIESFLSGKENYPNWCEWYAKNIDRFAQNQDWRIDFDKNYIMACDVS